MRVNRIIKHTKAEGPGERYCIWVQGCSHACEGCFGQDTWDYTGGYEKSSYQIISEISELRDSIRGITLLGGEPFDKSKDLAEVAEYAKSLSLDVIAFSGYLYEEIKADKEKAGLLKYVDLLIDGRFEKEKPEFSRPLAGSANQRFIYLTDCITQSEIAEYKNIFEVRINKSGAIIINGMGDLAKLAEHIRCI